MLKLSNITKDYVVTKELTVQALKGVTIDFRNNEFVSILGPSGCGKTTLLNIIGGLDNYTDGDLSIDNISTSSYKQAQWNSYRNNRIGFVFQSYNLIPHQTVVENVELALTLSGIGRKKRRQQAIDALIEVGLEDELYKKPNQLSGGQMQRVAIARALVNNPQIVLADEPTGALDSVTSVQVMELLRKVAQNHLVIMVTHNSELAEQYSTRIVKLKDGNIISDSDPFDADDATQVADSVTDSRATHTDSATVEGAGPTPAYVQPKVKMGFWTALSLSFKNLMTKKGRTFMTSFAGSIGIIGVALVLALSNGFNTYIDKLMSDTLSGFPITVSTIGYDLSSLQNTMREEAMNGMTTEEFPDFTNVVEVYEYTDLMSQSLIYNHITADYLDFVDTLYKDDLAREASDRWLNDILYTYDYGINVFTYNGTTYTMADSFQPAMGNSEFLLSQYDVLYGEYATEYNEIVLVIDNYNSIDSTTLDSLGIPYTSTTTDGTVNYDDIDVSDLIGKTYYVMDHDDYYSYNEYANLFTINTDSDSLSSAVDSDNTIELTVTGIVRVNPDSPLELFDTGMLYLPSLTEVYITNNTSSQMATKQAEANKDGNVYMLFETDDTSSPLYMFSGSIICMPASIESDESDDSMTITMTEEQMYQFASQSTGTSTIPSSINFYPVDFDGKDALLEYLDTWSDTEAGADNDIFYSDLTSIISASMGQMIDIISYVLIAFASISLVVSSVMIGIITYVSVIERTKEIGVLRSLGASKRNVSTVFNAESFLIGLIAGLIGVGVSYLLCIPINILLIAVAGGTITTSLAVLNPLSAIVLIVISCCLTLIAGSIPSKFAANLDPVKALRSE